ncbi:alpha/beta hydrolase [Tepidiforma sp.]|uniref:alpha/beta fold hydrolase n=1 Tax=Tepidiforma sp. TaxID=2682230 RepID=UPI002615FDB4|nr:alpha/beta hydrolase [Tepidiforma sp.]MCX7618014.1 alpha/beta hydrolase [Tepidiforma sp.]
MPLPPPIDQYALLRGLRFHYREWPSPGKPPLVLLHGFTGHSRSWDTFAAAMQPGWHVYALDQRGHGESAWSDDASADAMVEDVRAFVRCLGLERFALLGLSMGGRNAYRYAARYPEGLERLVIVDIGPEVHGAGAARIQAGVRAPDVFATPEEAVERALAANPNADPAEARHRTLHNLLRLEDGTWTFRYDRAYRDGSRPISRPDPEASWRELARIQAPTLLVRGERSDVLAPEVAERMAATIPDCRLVTVPGAGHSIPLERPLGFIAAVAPFLAED